MSGQRQRDGQAGASSASRPPVAYIADADTYGSTSTLSAETATGSCVLAVADYSGTKELCAASQFLASSTFTVGGCSCRIMYSPDGFSHETRGWICFSVLLEPPGAGAAAADLDAMVRTSYSFLDHAGQPVPSSVRLDDSVRTLSSMLGSWTDTRFMERARFESSRYVKHNRFSVRCDVTLVTRTCRPSGAMPPPDLRRHLGDLLATGVGADVTLECGGEAFPAHRSVLAARSPVFRAELFGGPPDKADAAATTTTRSRVRIHGIEPSVLKALLHFIYTDSLPETIPDDGDEKAAMPRCRCLLVAAQRYQLEGLERMCEDVLGISYPRTSLRDNMCANVSGCPL